MLAENEFEKINARRYIFDNLEDFDDDDLSNCRGLGIHRYGGQQLFVGRLSHLRRSAIDASTNGNNSIWEEADLSRISSALVVEAHHSHNPSKNH